MRVLVTGASGFLGRRLLPQLAGHEVVSLVPPAERPAASGGNVIVGDLETDGRWRQQVQRFAPQWCVHLAWAGLPDYSVARCRANVDASLRLIETLAHAGVKRVVVAGSCWEYGRAEGAVSEDRLPVDCGVFASAKHAVRTVLDSVARERGFEYRWPRIFFVYGPGQRSTSLIPHLHAAYRAGRQPELRDPSAVQDFVHVDDVVRGLVTLTENAMPSGVFNLGSGQPTSASQVANIVAAHFGQAPPFPAVEPGRGFWADPRRARDAGWQTGISLADGVEATLAALDGAM